MNSQVERGLVGIDIGAANIKCALGILDRRADIIDIIATSSVPTMGLREGKVTDIRSLTSAINEGVNRVKSHGQCEIDRMMISISSRYFYTLDAASTVDISEGRVTHPDVLDAVRACHEDALHAQTAQGGYGITHTLPQQYLLDHQAIDVPPWSQPALHLGLKAHLVYGHRDTMNTIWQLKRDLEAPLLDVVVDLLAQSEGALNLDEPSERAAVLDIGSETTKVLLMRKGKPVFLFNRLQGGVHLTNEIQRQLKIRDFDDAEQLKIRYGQVYVDTHERNETRIPLETEGPRRYIRQESLARILERALTENLSALRVRLEEAGVAELLEDGVVITGGTANIPGICTLAGDILQTKVTLGLPQQKGVKDLVQAPQYATVNGLVIAGFKRRFDHWFSVWPRDLRDIPHPLAKPRRERTSLWRHLTSIWSGNAS